MNLLTITDKFLKEREILSDAEFGRQVRKMCQDKEESHAPTLYQKFMELYDEFHQKKIGVGAKIDGRQGQALKIIITYITAQSKDKTDAGILASWEYILSNWHKLEPHYRNRLSLSDINSNLTNILNQLRNGNGNRKAPNTEESIRAIADWDGK